MRPEQVEPAEDIAEPDVLAYRLVARESPLDRAVLHELIGRPKRYAELKPLLGDKNDHNLTVALKRLQDWGLIERRTDARREPVVHTYELTPLGVQVVLAVPAIRPIHESLERYERARLRAALADLGETLRERTWHGDEAPTRFDNSVDARHPSVERALVENLLRAKVRDAWRPEPKLENFKQKEGRGKPRR